ncbi:MAG TPA: alpha/beta hydrolase [Candidatus Acidoferrales bacterium]|nr:alpha/beta hydrolase [Candidatus Acidoferrales bacterium]
MRAVDLFHSLMFLVPACFALAMTQAGSGKAPAGPRETWVHKFATVNGVKLHYVEQGKGPAILFLHGFPEFWYAWKDLLPEFGKDHRAIALDMRGYNLSESPAAVGAYRVPILVEDVRALMADLGVRKFVLVGHDWGGVVAWYFAAAHPELLDKLVIVNAPHPVIFARELGTNPDQQKASSYFNLFTSPSAEAVLGQNDFQPLQALLKEWGTDTDREKYLECWRRGLTGGLNFYRAANLKSPAGGAQTSPGDPPAPVSLAPIAVPTLVIWGEKDTALLTGNLNGLEEQVRNLKVRRVPEADHWVVHEQPALVIGAMREFLKP